MMLLRPLCLCILILLCSAAAHSVENVDDTAFSVARGFFDAPFSVEITTATAGATIRYTTDGSSPTPEHGQTYTGPIEITATTVLRAMAYKDGLESTNIDTNTYIFLADVVEQPAEVDGYVNYDASLGRDTGRHDYEMDPAVVDDPAYSDDLITGLQAIPTMSLAVDPDEVNASGGFYRGRGQEPCSVEIIYADAPAASHQADGFVEAHSHNRLKRSMRLNFRGSVGGDGKLETDLFQRESLHGASAVDSFDRVILRGGNNRSWARSWNPDKTAYTIDQFTRDSQLAMSGYGMRGVFVHLYINGLYWGLYNPVERADSTFNADYFGGDKEEWYTRNHGGTFSSGDTDATRFNDAVGSVSDNDLSDPAQYAELEEYLDIDGFCDYVMIHWYAGVGDWPGNNWYAANRNGDKPGPVRFFAWDSEWSWDAPKGGAYGNVHGSFTSGSGSTKGSAEPWNRLKDQEEFLIRFADRVYRHFYNGGVMTENHAKARWQALNDIIRDAVVAESARWGDAAGTLRTRDVDWQDEVDAIDGLMTGLRDDFIDDLRDEGYYPDIDPPLFRDGGTTIDVTAYSITPTMDLELSNPNGATGDIYYTLDGSDPRAHGGAPSANAIDAGDGIIIAIDHSTLVRARVQDGATWSALHELSLSALPTGEVPEIVISEALTHTDAPQVDSIEIFNPTGKEVDLGAWWLSDDPDDLQKFLIPAGTMVGSEDYVVFYEDDDDDPTNNDDLPPEYFGNHFALSSLGDEVFITAPDLSYSHGFAFAAAENGVSFGRYVTTHGEDRFPAQLSVTLSETNSGPRVGPVVIGEIMYHPDNADEYIELVNISDETVPLYDPANPANTWRVQGLDFAFPTDVELAPGELCVLVGDGVSPEDFRSAHGIDAGVQIFAVTGRLDNGGEALALMRPDEPVASGPDAGVVPFIVVDRVRFDDEEPWPLSADGTGPSLERIDIHAYGDDPINWRASADGGSPGSMGEFGSERIIRISVVRDGSPVSITPLLDGSTNATFDGSAHTFPPVSPTGHRITFEMSAISMLANTGE